MKKMIFGLVAVLVLFGAVVTYTHWDCAAPAAVAAAPTATAKPVETPTVHTLDYDAIRALYPADTAAMQSQFLFENDWLHLNAKGYETMGSCIDLNLFTKTGPLAADDE